MEHNNKTTLLGHEYNTYMNDIRVELYYEEETNKVYFSYYFKALANKEDPTNTSITLSIEIDNEKDFTEQVQVGLFALARSANMISRFAVRYLYDPETYFKDYPGTMPEKITTGVILDTIQDLVQDLWKDANPPIKDGLIESLIPIGIEYGYNNNLFDIVEHEDYENSYRLVKIDGEVDYSLKTLEIE